MSSIHPYLYTRGAFMKKKLLTGQDYQKLLKMDVMEITKFLEESEYKKEIDELALGLKGVDLIEAALNKNLGRFFQKIRQISDMQSKGILDIYLERWDVHNAKTAMRAVFSKMPTEKMSHLLVPAGAYPQETYIDLAKSASVEDAIKKIPFIDEEMKEKLSGSYGQTKSLLAIESMLDQWHYDKVHRLGKRLGSDASLFKRFLSDEISMLNLKMILRLRMENVDQTEVKKYLIMQEGKQDGELLAILNAPQESIVSEAAKTKYGKFLAGASGGVDVEIAADRYLVLKYASTLYMNPHSITPLLTIMFIKSAEVNNLKGLVKAKQLGMDQGFIEDKVVALW
jgi:V/A-type H+/Na+-transporting ATPase subunit C